MLFFITSCGTQKIASEPGIAKEMKTVEIIKAVNNQNPKFTHLNIQSKIKLELDNNQTSVNARIYILNGEKIWINVSKFGINGARALITPSGFQAFERIGKTYIDGDFSYFNELLKVNFIDYQKLQNLLLGRIFVDINPNEFESQITENQYWLTYKQNTQLTQNPVTGKYIQIYKFNAEFDLIEAYIKDPKSEMELLIYYDNWTKTEADQFPRNVKIFVKDRKTQKVELEYNNFTFEQSETPFEIPAGYKPNEMLK